MKKFETIVTLSAETIVRVNRLLGVDSFEAMTDDQLVELDVQPNSCEGIYCAKFEDGSVLNFDLLSNTERYFDDVVWTSPNGNVDVIFASAYTLEDIEVEVEGILYNVKIQTV